MRVFLAFCTLNRIFAEEISSENNPCPKNWVQATWVDMGCLLFNSTQTYTWEEASVYCQTEANATLVEIETEDQFEFLQMEMEVFEGQLNSHSWWVGASDIGLEGRWIWMRSLTSVNDFIWHSSQPNIGTRGNCLHIYSGYGYEGDDDPCTYKYYPICQQLV